MKHNHTFPQQGEDEGKWLCSSCDHPRCGPLAYCTECEAVTESYLFDEVPGSVSGHALHRLEQDTLADLDRLWIARRLDVVAEKRRAL